MYVMHIHVPAYIYIYVYMHMFLIVQKLIHIPICKHVFVCTYMKLYTERVTETLEQRVRKPDLGLLRPVGAAGPAPVFRTKLLLRGWR